MGRSRAALLVTAQKLHSQGDALVPLPRQDADISAVEGGLKDVLFVNVVVAVAWEDLDRERHPIKITILSYIFRKHFNCEGFIDVVWCTQSAYRILIKSSVNIIGSRCVDE